MTETEAAAARVGEDDLDALITDEEGEVLLAVGRDRSTAEKARLVRVDLADRTLMMGPRYALAVAECLTRHAVDVLNERKGTPTVTSEGRH